MLNNGDPYVWTLSQSSILTALRCLRHKNSDKFWTVTQISDAMPERWRPSKLQMHSCIRYLMKTPFVERGDSRLTMHDRWGRNGGGEVSIAGYRITARGVNQHDRFLSIVSDQTKRCNELIPGRTAA